MICYEFHSGCCCFNSFRFSWLKNIYGDNGLFGPLLTFCNELRSKNSKFSYCFSPYSVHFSYKFPPTPSTWFIVGITDNLNLSCSGYCYSIYYYTLLFSVSVCCLPLDSSFWGDTSLGSKSMKPSLMNDSIIIEDKWWIKGGFFLLSWNRFTTRKCCKSTGSLHSDN